MGWPCAGPEAAAAARRGGRARRPLQLDVQVHRLAGRWPAWAGPRPPPDRWSCRSAPCTGRRRCRPGRSRRSRSCRGRRRRPGCSVPGRNMVSALCGSNAATDVRAASGSSASRWSGFQPACRRPSDIWKTMKRLAPAGVGPGDAGGLQQRQAGRADAQALQQVAAGELPVSSVVVTALIGTTSPVGERPVGEGARLGQGDHQLAHVVVGRLEAGLQGLERGLLAVDLVPPQAVAQPLAGPCSPATSGALASWPDQLDGVLEVDGARGPASGCRWRRPACRSRSSGRRRWRRSSRRRTRSGR